MGATPSKAGRKVPKKLLRAALNALVLAVFAAVKGLGTFRVVARDTVRFVGRDAIPVRRLVR